MGLFGKLKVLVGIEEIDDDDDIAEEEHAAAIEQRKQIDTRSSYAPPRVESKEVKDNRVLTMQAGKTGQFKMVVTEPKSFDECPKLVDNLKSKKPVIINLEKIESDNARKIFDFLSGATYALNGNVQKIANNIFVFAPENVDVASSVDSKSTEYSDGSIKNPWR